MTARILAMCRRYIYLNLRSVPRVIELFFWPVMELLVWGFLARHMSALLEAGPAARVVANLLTGLIFWDILYRTQQSISLALMEEFWTKNLLHLMISPLRTWEWVTAAYLHGLLKTLVIVGSLAGLSFLFYGFSLTGTLGLSLLPFAANLLVMGLACGVFTTGLLLRWGHAAEALVWGVPFLIQPFSAIFYPLSAYPEALRPVCLAIPSTHVMEGMRRTLEGSFSYPHFFAALGLNAVYLVLAAVFFARMLSWARSSGRLVRLSD